MTSRPARPHGTHRLRHWLGCVTVRYWRAAVVNNGEDKRLPVNRLKVERIGRVMRFWPEGTKPRDKGRPVPCHRVKVTTKAAFRVASVLLLGIALVGRFRDRGWLRRRNRLNRHLVFAFGHHVADGLFGFRSQLGIPLFSR